MSTLLGEVTFDIAAANNLSPRKRRQWILGFVGFGLILILLWAVTVVPGFFQTPHSTEICGAKAAVCSKFSPSSYYWVLAYWSGLFLVPAACVFVLMWAWLLRKGPTGLSFDSVGLTLDYGSRRRESIRWRDPGLYFGINDRRELARSRPSVGDPSPIICYFHWGAVFLTEPAFLTLIAKAREQGLRVDSQDEDGKGGQPAGSVTYTIKPGS